MTKTEVRKNILEAFKDLRKEGFLARANFLCCQNCAGYELTLRAEKLIEEGKDVKGCVFWHGQDEDDWKKRGHMFIAYGDMNSNKWGKIGLSTKEVGEKVVETFKKHEVPYKWDGNPNTRIEVQAGGFE